MKCEGWGRSVGRRGWWLVGAVLLVRRGTFLVLNLRLHVTDRAETECQVESRLLLDVVAGQGVGINIVDGVRGLDFEGDGLFGDQGLGGVLFTEGGVREGLMGGGEN
jgi:hypothetical protein